MNDSPSTQESNSLDCPIKNQWVSFRLVDEHGEATCFSGIAFQLYDMQGQAYRGSLDHDGFALIKDTYCGPMLLSINAEYRGGDSWYEHLLDREDYPLPLTALQIAAEQSPIGPRRSGCTKTYLAEERATQEGARFYRVEVSDLVEAINHLPDPDDTWGPRPSAGLKQASGATADQPGIALEPNQHHVFEVKALRAYSPIFSTSPEFSALNAYQLAVMCKLSYAPFSIKRKGTEPSHPPPYLGAGSIGNVLREQLACQKKPTLFDTANFHLLSEEVPYSKRFEVVPYDPGRYPIQSEKFTSEDEHFLHDDKTDTQAFITHNDKVILISVRGSASFDDWLRDFDARQVPIKHGTGNAHRGFHEAYLVAQRFTADYLGRFYTNGQTIIVSGHSLGGSIALLLANWIKRLHYAPKVILYTYGAPRAGDRAFVESAKSLVHHRIVNNNDLVPSVPATWMDAEWKIVVPGLVMLLASLAPPIKATSLLLAGLVNLQGDPYHHHGEQHYFMPRRPGGGSEASVLWQPGCAALEEGACARFTANLSITGDATKRRSFITQIASFPHHYSDSGYARAALTNLLRWNASLSRDGNLFTEEEKVDLRSQLYNLMREIEAWGPGSFVEFRKMARNDMRFYNKTSTEMHSFYQQYLKDVTSAEELQDQEMRNLNRAQQRLTAQASRTITPAAVFGDQADRDDLQQIVSEWRQEELNKEAERLARQDSHPVPGYQYG
tara:strand:- start:15725 stop:17896 length:2172 start_codon:yes stop_codon:yes gene_type:complete